MDQVFVGFNLRSSRKVDLWTQKKIEKSGSGLIERPKMHEEFVTIDLVNVSCCIKRRKKREENVIF